MNRRRTLYAILFLAVVGYPLIYIGNYAGDSQVHLIYAEHAARGAFFEFNPGEKSSGVTSPGYMLLIAGFFKAAPDTWVPAFVKATNLLFWYGLVALVFLAAKAITCSVRWATVGALAAGLLPGSAYNSTNGMENGIFAFLIWVWILGAIRSGWFESELRVRDAFQSELLMGSLLGVACWFRPEGFVVAAVALTFRAMVSQRSPADFGRTIARSTVTLIPFVIITGALVCFHWVQTGDFIPTSGSSRVLMSNLATDTIRAGPAFFSPKMTIRLAEYFPLTLTSFLAIRMVLQGRRNLNSSAKMIGFFCVMFWSFFILYSFVLGSVHLSRYLVFAMPALVLMAIVGAKWAWESWEGPERLGFKHTPVLIAAFLVVALIGVYSVETGLRLRLDSQASLWHSMQAPIQRQAFSDELVRLLGEPESRPISIALQEIQVRYWLDHRFVVRSLDGRTDPVLLDYADRVSIDHIGYLRERQIQFLLDTPNYNRDPEAWSLRRLDALMPGEEVSNAGVTFVRIAIDPTPVELANEAETGEPRWFTGEAGLIRLHWFMVDLIRLEYPEL